MSSITLENSYISTSLDMGDSHISAHSHQHKYLQKNEPLIETLTGNKRSDNSTQLALQFAQDHQGLLTPQQWKKYNSKLRQTRKKNSYLEYLLGVSGNFQKAKQRRLDNSKTAKPTREKLAREIAATINNSGIPIDGSLYYLSNTELYDSMNNSQLIKYRQFEATTFRKFFNSTTFKTLNPGCFRAEIHYDESGAIHMQTQSIWFHRDARKRLTYAKRATIKKLLEKRYGSAEALQNRLDVLCYYDHTVSSEGRQKGTERADMRYYSFMLKHPNGHISNNSKKNKNGTRRKYKYSAAERNTRLTELWRIEQMHALGIIAEQTAKKMGINYRVDHTYTTDGIHLDSAAYINHKESHKKITKYVNQAQIVNDAAQQVMNDVKSTYKTLTGKNVDAKSPLEIAKHVNNTVKTIEKDITDNQNIIKQQQKQIDKQQKQLASQRQQLLSMQQQQKKIKSENQKLKEENQTLKERIKQLQNQAKSAGLIISRWIRRNWAKLERHFKDYARDINAANNERIFGGINGHGDRYKADEYERKAKEGLLASLDRIERDEINKSDLPHILNGNHTKQKYDNLQR